MFKLVVDDDECAQGSHACAKHALCTDTLGSYTCQCKPGFFGDGWTYCEGMYMNKNLLYAYVYLCFICCECRYVG